MDRLRRNGLPKLVGLLVTCTAALVLAGETWRESWTGGSQGTPGHLDAPSDESIGSPRLLARPDAVAQLPCQTSAFAQPEQIPLAEAAKPVVHDMPRGASPQSPSAEPPAAQQSSAPRVDARWESEEAAAESSDAPPALLRPLAGPSGRRSWALELAARQADMHTQRGFELASRGAPLAARGEFYRALRILAQALDTQRQTTRFSQALSEGLVALREASDFLPNRPGEEAEPDFEAILANHRTKALCDADCRSLVRQSALRAYFTYAQDRLAEAVDEELAGAMALYGLGKLYASLSRAEIELTAAAGPKAMAFLQSSLLACPRHYMAANELGVLLAQIGRCDEACRLLEHSVSIQPHAAGYRNLRQLYKQMGRADLAERVAQAAGATAAQEAGAAAVPEISWVPPGIFAQMSARFAGQPAVDFSSLSGHSLAMPASTIGGIRLCAALQPLATPADGPPGSAAGDWSGRGGWDAPGPCSGSRTRKANRWPTRGRRWPPSTGFAWTIGST